MKKRDEHNHRKPILEKEVSTPKGKYHLKLIQSPNSVFPKSFDLEITHLGCGFLELFLAQDETLCKDACHDYHFKDKDYQHVEFRNTAPQEVGYNSTIGKFYIHFHQEVISQAKGDVPNLPRTKHFPIPTTIYDRLKEWFRKKSQ